jgi:hypothetical protein
MYDIFSRWLGGVILVVGAACGGDDNPEACPVFPPCITGSTWNARTCACVLDDELPDATDGAAADHATEIDQRVEASEEIASPDAGSEASDAPVD